ncbi:citrate synthase family protein [Telmatospirillum siberiense]|uniref:citrate synthase (unknown stereospecificity) n=1 Tax=Telmatospirillum siberiense TaxID=382514 RepID=A0A2N3PZ54_9PROT|nr:citrate synthase family protein [Telmatospirillum siberiense]PKU25665.1 citrate synthase [Telmatospirillum siberiense]
MTHWLTQDEATKTLGVRAQTLYSYVSRGRIEVCPDPTDARRSLYRADDIDDLIKRRERRRKPSVLAASTMSWGEPSITTTISTIAKGRLYYRGRDAVAQSAAGTMEETAGLLWGMASPPDFPSVSVNTSPGETPRERAFRVLGRAAASGMPSQGRAGAVLYDEGAALIGLLASAFGDLPKGRDPLHRRLTRAWNGNEAAADVIRRALVLLADQELTSSAFAARVAASTGAPLAAAMLAGLATLCGPLHGDMTVRVSSLFEEVARTGADQTLRRHISSGLPIPGFGHHLYPDGDPRAVALLDAFTPPADVTEMVEKVAALTGLRPTIDVALAALVIRFDLPSDAAFSLFAVGRAVGWLAHSVEQGETGSLIRPRARYAGPPVTAIG